MGSSLADLYAAHQIIKERLEKAIQIKNSMHVSFQNEHFVKAVEREKMWREYEKKVRREMMIEFNRVLAIEVEIE